MPRTGRQTSDLATGLRLGDLEVVLDLKGQPELWIVPEPVREAERRVASDGTLAIHDLRDAVCGHVKLPGQFGRRYANFL